MFLRSLLVVAVMAPVVALAQTTTPMDMSPGAKPMDMGTPAEASSPAAQAFTDAMQSMMQKMVVPASGDPDKDFVAMMMPHHQGAIDMAKVELQYGKDPLLLKMAKAIVAAQEKEIAEMKAWEAKHGK